MGVDTNKQAVITGLVLTLLGIGATISALLIERDYSGGFGPKLFPLIAAISLLVMGLLELFGSLRISQHSEASAPEQEAEQIDKGALTRILGLLVLAIIYIWLISKIGYLLSTGITTFFVMLLFGVRNPLVLLITVILCPIAYHAIFFWGLGVYPPYSEWFDLATFLGVN
ncbi:MAG: hypothetical protein COA78_16575 [Blastopirellula sp.]|nr:MAG: hypothetical protein COA78_16575 [Blastopirellula sp.]